ncbi:MAG: preprotein translocase subunit SecE [Thermodesulfobacteriota bacterium]|nr:preprotein translocase subunit SecE [Thermodesulfobacteriota bacterium]
MGRLQRKKSVSKKKNKKKNVDMVTSSHPKDNVVREKAALIVSPSSVVKRKQTLPQKKSASVTRQDKNYLNKGLQFLREVKVELKKVIWPTRKQTLGSTIVVIILVMIIALFLGVVDIGLSSLVRVFIQ